MTDIDSVMTWDFLCRLSQSWQQALDCSDITNEARSRVLTNLSLCLRHLDRLPEALAAAQKAINVDSTWYKASTTSTILE